MKRSLIAELLLGFLMVLGACSAAPEAQQHSPLISGLKKTYVSSKEYTNIEFKTPAKARVKAYFANGNEYTGLNRKGKTVKMFVYAGDKATYTIKAKLNNQTDKKKFTIQPNKKVAAKVSSDMARIGNSKNEQDSKSATDTTTESSSSQTDLTASALEDNLPSNDTIESAITEQNSNLDIESINGSYTDTDSTVQITLNGRELLTKKQTEKGMLMDISDVWKAIKKNTDYSKFSNIGVSVKYPLVDESGKSEPEFVIKSDMTGTKLELLNTDSFDWNNVPTFATSWWQSPALPEL